MTKTYLMVRTDPDSMISCFLTVLYQQLPCIHPQSWRKGADWKFMEIKSC